MYARLDRHTDERRQPLGQTRQLRRTTGHDDAQQLRRAGLVAVVVDRAADLVEQHRQRTVDRRARPRRPSRRASGSPSARFNASAVSAGTSRSVAIASVSSRPPLPSTRTNCGTPPSCTAIAVTPPPNDTMPSAPSALFGERDAAASAAQRRRAPTGTGAGERAGQRERDEVDRADLEAAGLDRGDEPAHRRFVRGDEQHLHRRLAAVARARRVPRIAKSSTASSIGIGMRSPAWNCNALVELVARHHRHLDLAHDDARAGDADAHRHLLQADLGAQPRDRVGDRGFVGDLALAHRVARRAPPARTCRGAAACRR